MARDLRQVGCLNEYPDRCYFYDSTSVEKNTLKPDSTPLGRFYKKDKISFQWERITVNGTVTNRKMFIGTIETMDHVEAIRPDMFVKDQTGMLFRVGTPVISDDENRSKNIGRRSCIRTTMKLIGLEIRVDNSCEAK